MGHSKKEQVTIFTTNACNMRCKYCAANSSAFQEEPQTINLKFAKRGISDYFQGGSKHQIRYYSGGETTQSMDIISETWEYAHSLVNDRLISEIQTNCYFDKDTAEWLAKHIDIIWVSLDGWPEIQDKYRPMPDGRQSSDVVLENLAFLKDHTFVGVRATVVPETVDKQVELIEYFHSLGINYVATEPVFEPVRQDVINEPGQITGVSLKEYAENFVKAWHASKKMGVTYINSFIVNFDEECEYSCRACLPTPHLTTDGYVSACDLGFYGNTPLKNLIYGKYDAENDRIIYSDEAITKLRSRKCSNINACKKCNIQKHCAGGCLGRSYHETRDFYGVIPEYCWITRYFAKNIPFDQVKIPYLHP